jgi:hypothetical protein
MQRTTWPLVTTFDGVASVLNRHLLDFQEGKTDSGHRYIFAAACEKGTAVNQFIYCATAAVWLAERGITVTTIFEGQGQMRSRVFQSIESADFESAAKSICLSPR